MTRRHAVLIFAVWVALVAVSVSLARPPRSGPAVRPPAVPHLSQGRRPSHGGARHPYWRLERRYVAQQHRMGRLGAEVRRLRRQTAVRTLQDHLSAAATIRLVFGPTYGDGAVTVATCESGLNPAASNGTHLGIFEMGASERAIYGHGPTVLDQSLSAYRYFVASGYHWSGPWRASYSCHHLQ